MRYVVKLLDNVSNINSFDVVGEILLTRGNQFDMYFQLMVERSNNQGEQLQRYVPQGTDVKVEVQFDNLDQEYHIRRVASKAFTGDDSIWKVPVISQDQLMFNSMRVTLIEDGKKTSFLVETDIATEDVGDRRRFT